MTLDLNKPLQTRDGRPARVVASDVKNRGTSDLLAVLITNNAGQPNEHEWSDVMLPDGKSILYGSNLDLFNVPEKEPFGDSEEGKRAIIFLRHFVPADAREGLLHLAHSYLTSDNPKEPLMTVARKVYYACKQAALKEI